MQVVAPPGAGGPPGLRPAPALIEEVDLSHLPPAERAPAARRLAAAEARRPFDLLRGPLLRATLARLHEGEHVLLLTVHHIVADGWSLGILLRELESLYGGYVEGRLPSLPDLPLQYADFAVWQRRWLQGTVLEGQLRYWREQLAGPPAPRVRGGRTPSGAGRWAASWRWRWRSSCMPKARRSPRWS